mgnify:CR=1 FL=1
MMRLRFDKKGRVKITAGNNALRLDLGKLVRVISGKERRSALKEAKAGAEKLRREGGR